MEINSIGDLPNGSNPTPEQIREFANRVLITIHNLVYGNGTYGAVDEIENGQAGNAAFPSRTLPELMKLHKYLLDLLENPELMEDIDFYDILVSEFDNPYR